jgi:predicted kinase
MVGMDEWFEATGEGGVQLEGLAQDNAQLSGSDLASLAENTRQVIWGEFVGRPPGQSDKTWVVIRAVDSTFYEVNTDDETVLSKMSSTYKDVRVGEASVTSWLLQPPGE